jgi:hypothetical protein
MVEEPRSETDARRVAPADAIYNGSDWCGKLGPFLNISI